MAFTNGGWISSSTIKMSKSDLKTQAKRFKATDEYDQFKFGDQRLVEYISNKNLVIYDNKWMKIGDKDCDCSSFTMNIRNAFNCDNCHKLHEYSCSKQDERTLIANEYYNSGENLCLPCINISKLN